MSRNRDWSFGKYTLELSINGCVRFKHSNMDFDLFSCTFENLNNLNYNELRKLSCHYRVNKRWAKKREIIENLILLRDQELQRRVDISDNVEKNASEQGMEWMNGNIFFSSCSTSNTLSNNAIDRRLTYNVSQPTEEIIDRRLTFNVVKDERNKKVTKDVNIEISGNIDRRLTYNTDDINEAQKKLMENITESSGIGSENDKTSNFVLEANNHSSAEIESSSLPVKQVLPHNEKSNIIKKEGEKLMSTSYNHTAKPTSIKPVKAKMLTIPYSRIPTEKPAVKEEKRFNVNEEKSNERLPRTVKTKLDPSKIAGSTKSLIDKNNGSSSLKLDLVKPSVQSEVSTLDTTRRILPRRKSKTEDNVLVTDLKLRKTLKFFSPTESGYSNRRRLSDPNNVHLDKNIRSKIPKAKVVVETQKPVTAKKMPDFSKIHQRQFDQMDSLLDYKRKKEERARKLFGIPQPGIPVKVNKGNVSSTLFEFKSSYEKENQSVERGKINKPNPLDVKQQKEKPNRQNLMSRAATNSTIVKAVKEQNRMHLSGVRTNKRFELQMKFRKL